MALMAALSEGLWHWLSLPCKHYGDWQPFLPLPLFVPMLILHKESLSRIYSLGLWISLETYPNGFCRVNSYNSVMMVVSIVSATLTIMPLVRLLKELLEKIPKIIDKLNRIAYIGNQERKTTTSKSIKPWKPYKYLVLVA